MTCMTCITGMISITSITTAKVLDIQGSVGKHHLYSFEIETNKSNLYHCKQ